MSGFLGLISNRLIEKKEFELLTGAINLSSNLTIKQLETSGALFATSSLKVTPLQGDRIFENEGWVLLFAGDLIDCKGIPHQQIIQSLQQKNYEYFDSLEGTFSIAAFKKDDKKVVLVTDRRSQYPLYLYLSKDTVCFSTDLSVFCRLERLEFDKTWLWEYLFFNFPVSNVTFIRGVRRIEAGKVIIVDSDSMSTDEFKYAKPFESEEHLLEGKKALSFALDAFKNRVPLYFAGSEEIACALTSGWDGRTVLALAPHRDHVTAYTYGVPGCEDLEKAERVAQKTGTKHIPILFDSEVVKELPHYMLETVYISSGAQGILRGTLLFAYESLTQKGRRFPVTISGIFVDCLFRGHAAFPPLISYDMVDLFEGRSISIKKDLWVSFFNSEYPLFEKHISIQLEGLRKRFGEFTSASNHLSYLVYLAAPQYFGGEVRIANHFTTIRVPAWDRQIVGVAYKIKPSTLTFSQFTGHVRGSHDEMVLQSYIMNRVAPEFAKIPVGSTRPDFVIKGEYAHFTYKVYNYLKRRLLTRSKVFVPLEDWDYWLGVTHKGFIQDLIFSPNSEIKEYISGELLRQLWEKPDLHFIGKLATAEIILRLIKTRWQRFW